MHIRGLLKGSVRLAEVASSCGRVSIYATRCQNSVLAKFGSAAVRWAGISPVVAALQVATPCYKTEQRTLLGRSVSMPKGYPQATLKCLEPNSVGSLLLRTSENSASRTFVNKGKAGLTRSPAYCSNAKTILGLEGYPQAPYGPILRNVVSIHQSSGKGFSPKFICR
jgi:hypothetical protein